MWLEQPQIERCRQRGGQGSWQGIRRRRRGLDDQIAAQQIKRGLARDQGAPALEPRQSIFERALNADDVLESLLLRRLDKERRRGADLDSALFCRVVEERTLDEP